MINALQLIVYSSRTRCYHVVAGVSFFVQEGIGELLSALGSTGIAF